MNVEHTASSSHLKIDFRSFGIKLELKDLQLIKSFRETFSVTSCPIPDSNVFCVLLQKRNYSGECLPLNPFWGTNKIADKVYNNYGKSHLLNVGWLNQSHHGSSAVTRHHLSVNIRMCPHVEMWGVSLWLH